MVKPAKIIYSLMAVVIVLGLTTASVLAPLNTNYGSLVGEKRPLNSVNYTSVPLLIIEGDDGFAPLLNENYFIGSGTEEDPYKLFNGEIVDQDHNQPAIKVVNTSKYFIIEDCRLEGEYGLLLTNVSNLVVSGTEFSSNTKAGVRIHNVTHSHFSSNTYTNNGQYGIWINNTGKTNFTSSTYTNNGELGIYVENNTMYGEVNKSYISYSSFHDNGVNEINITNAQWLVIEYNTLTSPHAHGLFTEDCANLTISYNTASNNYKEGFYLTYIFHSNITDNIANDNGDPLENSRHSEGFLLESSDNNTFAHNTAMRNTYGGMWLEKSYYNQLINNTWVDNDNGFGGIWLRYSYYNNLTGNNASFNEENGIDVTWGNYNQLINNTCNWNGYDKGTNLYIDDNNWGIRIDGSHYTLILNNTAMYNDDFATEWDGGGIQLFSSARNTQLINNTVSHNHGNGIEMYHVYLDTMLRNQLISNYAENNTEHGIYMDGADGLYANNTLVRNWGSGMYGGAFLNSFFNNTVYNNTFANNYQNGLTYRWNYNNTIANNTFSANFDHGFYRYGNSTHAYNDIIVGNIIRDNGASGVFLEGVSNNTKFWANNFVNDGLSVDLASLKDWLGIDFGLSSEPLKNYINGQELFIGVNLTQDDNGDIPTDAGQIILLNSKDLSITGLNMYQTDTAVLLAYTNNTQLANSEFKENWVAVWIQGGTNNTIRDSTFKDNRFGAIIQDGEGHHFRENLVNNTYWDGLLLDNAHHTTVALNTFSFNRQNGVHLKDAHYNNVTTNTLFMNGYRDASDENGIYVHRSNYNWVQENTAYENDDYGILDEFSHSNTYVANTLHHNRFGGIRLYSSENQTLVNNTAFDNYDPGFFILSSDFATLINNTAHHNGNATEAYPNGHGIYVSSSHNATLIANTVYQNVESGIYITSSDNATTNGTYAWENWNYGIEVYSSDNALIHNNTLHNNTDGGVTFTYSENAQLVNNTFTLDGLAIGGSGLSSYIIAVVENNIVNGKPLVYIQGYRPPAMRNGGTIPSEAGQIIIVNSTHIELDEYTISETAIGILVAYSSFISVTNSELTHNKANGVKFYEVDHSIISDNNISLNGHYGTYLMYCDNLSITGNTWDDNYGYGLYLYVTDNSDVIANSATGHTWDGFRLYYSDGNVLKDNGLSENLDDGISASVSDDNVFENNTVYLTGGTGFEFTSVENTTIKDNRIFASYVNGIYLEDSNELVIVDNTILASRYNGILLYSTIRANISWNTVAFSGTDGIDLYLASHNNTVHDNLLIQNAMYGILTDRGDGEIPEDNEIKENTLVLNNRGNTQVYDDGTDNSYSNNYFSDWTTPDTNNDNVVDNPYIIDGSSSNQDTTPVTSPHVTIPEGPTINSPGNKTIASGTTGQTLTWSATGTNPVSYWILRNRTLVESGLWTSGGSLSTSLDGLDSGLYEYVFIAQNDEWYSADVVWLFIAGGPIAPTLSSPSDILYIEGATGNEITWTVTDDNPESWLLLKNGTNIDNGDFSSGLTISIQVNGLVVGTYNYTLVVTDEDGLTTADTVIVNVSPVPSVPTIDHPSDISYTEGGTGNVIAWTPYDDNPANYTIYRNSVEVASGDWSSGTTITVNVDGLSVGIYEYKIIVQDEDDNKDEDIVNVEVTVSTGTTTTTTDFSSTTSSASSSGSSESSESSDATTSSGGSSPGFELILSLVAIVAFVVYRRRQS